MYRNALTSKLNSLVIDGKKQGASLDFDLEFRGGNFDEQASILAKEKVPFGKVAILCFNDGYEGYSKSLSTLLIKNGNPTVHVVLPDNFIDSIERYSHVFNLPDDVRMVVATDSRLYGVAKYFATVRNIECVLLINSLSCYTALKPVITFANGKWTDKVKNTASISIVIDFDLVNLDKKALADAYAFTVSHALSFVDYRVNSAFEKYSINKVGYALARNAVTSIFPLFAYPIEQRNAVIVQNLFTLLFADALCDGKLTQVFSCAKASAIISGAINGENMLGCAKEIAQIYQMYLSQKYDKIMEYPNYIERADWLAKKSYRHDDIVDKLCSQAKKINANNLPSKIMLNLSKDVQSFIKCSSTMLSTFIALGGGALDVEKRADAIKYSGDLELNLMSLVRESGILEHI